MKTKRKVIFKIFSYLLGLLILFNMIPNDSTASTTGLSGKVQYIYNQKTFLAGEEVILTINLTNVAKVSEIDLRINVDSDALEPVMINNRYFTFTALSIFEKEDLINNYSDGILWLKLTKTHNINEDYVVNSKNNVGTVKFTTLVKINNIEDYLNNEKIIINLFDASRNKIEVLNNYSEKINYNWTFTNNSIMVNSDNLSLYDYFTINNRLANEYRLTITDNINYQKIGSYEIKICLYDLINEEIINETMRLNVVDLEAPVISKFPSGEIIEIDDVNLANLNLNTYFEFTDNYDQNVVLRYHYFTDSDEPIASFEQFVNHLTVTPIAKFKVTGIDSSSNMSEELTYILKVKDTMAPSIEIVDEIEIRVTDELRLDEYLTIKDNYDIHPIYTATYFYEDGTECFDATDAIIKGKNLLIKIIAFDDAGNSSDEKMVTLNVIDNISPEIIIKSLEIEDKFVKNFDYLNHFEFKDNISKNFRITIVFNAENQVDNSLGNDQINERFRKNLTDNLSTTFDIQIKDEAGNACLLEKCTIKVLDLTAPEITVSNIKNNETYNKLDFIDYQIVDNYSSNIITEVLVNDSLYNGYLELKEGANSLKITATDEFNNTNTLIIDFIYQSKITDQKTEITKDSPKTSLKTESIFLIVIMIISLLIVAYRTFFINYKFKHKIQK